eukprot:PITA_29388
MEDCRPMATPMITNWKKIDASEDKDVDPTLYRHLIGSLMYLVNTRLDICYSVNTLSQFMVESKRAHWAIAKHVLRYLQGTVDYGLLYAKSKDIRLSGFTDADWAGSSVDRKSTFGDCVQRGALQLSYTPIGEQVADILTKALGRTKFDYFREEMGMIKNPFQ